MRDETAGRKGGGAIRRRLWAVPAVMVLALAVPAAAQSVPASTQHLDYEVYAAGLDAVTATLDIAEGGDRYAMTLRTATRGLLGKLVPWQASFETDGDVDKDGGFHPAMHRSTGGTPKDNEIKIYRYAPDGAFRDYKVTQKGRDVTPKTLDPKLVDRTIDALTGALAVMRAVATRDKCEGASEVFDGDRRYRMVFHDQGRDILKASNYNIYEGPARRCSVEVVPLAGKWHAKPRGWLSIQEQGRKLGALPTVWLANMEHGAPAVPVRLRVVTDYGTLYMHVIHYTNDKTAQKIETGADGHEGK